MADIVEFNITDGLTPWQVRKLNHNFRALAGIEGGGQAEGSQDVPTIAVGSTVTLPPGSQARVENSGTMDDIVLDFYVPGSITDYDDLVNKPVVVENGKVYIGDDYGPDSDMNHIVIIASGITQQNAFAFDRYDGLLVYALRILRGDIPQSDIYSGGVRMADRNGRQIGYLQAVQRTDGNEGIDFGTSRVINNVEEYNSVSLFIDDAGNPWVQLSYPASWRTALGLGDAATEDIVPLAKGGTGASNASDARDNLGLGALATKDSASVSVTTVSGSGKNSAAIAAGSAATIDIAISPASGYTPIGIRSISFGGTGNSNLVMRRWDIASGTSVTIAARNVGSSSVAANAVTCTVEVYCIRTTAT